MNLQVLLVDGKGTPLASEMIFIEADEANYHFNATTDKNGLVWFSINTDDILGTSLSIRVSVERVANGMPKSRQQKCNLKR